MMNISKLLLDMMKNLKLIFLILILLSSCGVRNYTRNYENNEPPDLLEGKWLINHIESDLYLKAQRKFTEKLLSSLEKVENDSIFFIEQVKIDTMGPALIRYDISKEKLYDLREFTDFDYLLNTRIFVERKLPGEGEKGADSRGIVYYKTLFHIYSIPASNLFYEQEVSLEYPLKKSVQESLSRKDQRRMYRSLKEAVKYLSGESEL